MYIASLKLANFKNYAQANISFSPGINIITGNNGQGKTNILDAIYLLCMTKSYFQFSEKNVVKFNETFFRAEGRYNDEGKIHDIVCKFQLPNKKTFSFDDKTLTKYSAFIGRFPVVMIAPNDIYLIEEGSEERRKFIDISICQCDLSYLEGLNKYNKLLKLRNACLKQINQKQTPQDDLISYYNHEMATLSAMIVTKRHQMTDELNELFAESYQFITEGKEKATCQYLPDNGGDSKAFIQMFENNYKKDVLLERTTHGIHRDDLEFLLNGHVLRKIGSQGQIKSSVFAAKLSQYQWLKNQKNVNPLLLLDDIFDKLDHNRVSSVMKIIDSSDFGQIFITDTYEERIHEILTDMKKQVRSYKVADGLINETK